MNRLFFSGKRPGILYAACLSMLSVLLLLGGCTRSSENESPSGPGNESAVASDTSPDEGPDAEPATTLSLTLNGRAPKDGRVFGHDRDRTLGGGKPDGGVYSGPGVKDGIFNPAQAGNGVWTITYSKPGYKPSSATIEVFGTPENISDRVCGKCGGKQTEVCPVCGGAKEVDGAECANCGGTGTVPCRECLGDDEINDGEVITYLAPKLACSRMTLDSLLFRTDDFVLKLVPEYGITNFEDFEPVMYVYLTEQATGKLKRYTLPNMTSERIECRKDPQKEGAPATFTYKVEGDKLLESGIRFIEISTYYGHYDVSLFFDLNDIVDGDKISGGDLNIKYLLFNEKYYEFPRTVLIDDLNDRWKKSTSDKGWQTEEIYSGWLLQKNAKGELRILDKNRMVRMEGEEKPDNGPDMKQCWADVKKQMENPKKFWDDWFRSSPPGSQLDKPF